MKIIRTKNALRGEIAALKRAGYVIGFVPTMGALHAGHLSLVEHARTFCDKVVVSVFVNPKQFGPNEDYASYPRQEAQDLEKLSSQAVDVAYVPEVQEMFPEHFTTRVHVGGVSEGLDSITRPHFFDGVATIVAKLLLQVMPDVAVFGEKDYQQVKVVKRLVQDLDIPVRVEAAPIVREVDGLAMSSRNVYLNESQRKIAPRIFQVLQDTAEKIKSHPGAVQAQLDWAKAVLKDVGFDVVDYVELREAESLHPLAEWDTNARLFAAAYLGKTRLIDNVAVDVE